MSPSVSKNVDGQDWYNLKLTFGKSEYGQSDHDSLYWNTFSKRCREAASIEL